MSCITLREHRAERYMVAHGACTDQSAASTGGAGGVGVWPMPPLQSTEHVRRVRLAP